MEGAGLEILVTRAPQVERVRGEQGGRDTEKGNMNVFRFLGWPAEEGTRYNRFHFVFSLFPVLVDPVVSKKSVASGSWMHGGPIAEVRGGTCFLCGLCWCGARTLQRGHPGTDVGKSILCKSHIPQALKD